MFKGYRFVSLPGVLLHRQEVRAYGPVGALSPTSAVNAVLSVADTTPHLKP